ncbi:helix-hairpin-helix domain-containing protein [Cytobacillus kochii]|uniref:helix-hairpin-helix domain-containing protein n=1 Tax=Cytobacillus kochii TaxID=859143 RepID=UPI001CD4FA79|nr:helix-hairpin-helix domain-containing protein [Cytobacillus kochii]MCA1028647.1 helix-hairpin-helix domain-containing protein [Cytobacillus kochii]
MTKSLKLPLEKFEKRELRRNKIKLSQIPEISEMHLSEILKTSVKRSKKIIAHAKIQQIPSIGPKLASNIIKLGFYSLEDIKDQDGAHLTDLLEKRCGCWIDPCVEDQLRLVINYANNGDLGKKWWEFTKERKIYREKNGYPTDRPTKACEKLF